MARTAFLTHESFLAHDTGPRHPERPDRLRAIVHGVDTALNGADLVRPVPEPVPLAEAERCHSRALLETAERAFTAEGLTFLDPDTVVGPNTQEAVCRAVGAGRLAADLIVAGEVANAFCAVRPPGHHATPRHSMGFCVVNNIALLARYLQDAHGAERILIVDWDVHHGNGTQDIFYDDPSVFYYSVHQYPHYPGTGAPQETGAGAALGTTLNTPLLAGAGDAEYLTLFDSALLPAADAFQPEWVLISAGFDAHAGDPLSSMAVTTAGFAALTERVLAIAARHCAGRCISYLEGGYDLNGLAESVVAHLDRLRAAAA